MRGLHTQAPAPAVALISEFQPVFFPPASLIDDLVGLAASVLQAPMAALMTRENDRWKCLSSFGLPHGVIFDASGLLDAVTAGTGRLVIRDLRADPRFQSDPLVTGEPFARFCAAVLLMTLEEAEVVFCILDPEVRLMDKRDFHTLETFGRRLAGRLAELPPPWTPSAMGTTGAGPGSHSERQFRAMANTAPVMIWTSGPDRRCHFFNKAWLDFTGRTLAQEIGDGWAEGVHPDDVPRCLHIYESSFENRQTFRMEYRLRRHDGKFRWILDSGAPWFGVDGTFLGYIGSCIDISGRIESEANLRRAHDELERRVKERTAELHRAVAELRASQDRYELAVRGTDDGIWEWNVATNENFFSSRWCELLGYQPDELPRRVETWSSRLHPEDRDRVLREVRRHLEERLPYNTEFRLRTKSGAYRWFRAKGQAIWDAHDKPVRMAGSISDVTEGRLAEEKLREYQGELRTLATRLLLTEEQERRRIAADIHDQLGQTLAACKLKLGEAGEALGAHPARALVTEVRGLMMETIRQVRSLTFELSPPVLYELGLEAALQWLAEKMQQEHRIQITVAGDGRCNPMANDVRVLLFRIARELLINAVRHAQAGQVTIHLQRVARVVHLTVEDDGIGFHPHSPDTGPKDDPGFGLFSIRERLSHIGGRIQIDSKPGKGSRIKVAAPLEIHTAHPHEHPNTAGGRP